MVCEGRVAWLSHVYMYAYGSGMYSMYTVCTYMQYIPYTGIQYMYTVQYAMYSTVRYVYIYITGIYKSHMNIWYGYALRLQAMYAPHLHKELVLIGLDEVLPQVLDLDAGGQLHVGRALHAAAHRRVQIAANQSV